MRHLAAMAALLLLIIALEATGALTPAVAHPTDGTTVPTIWDPRPKPTTTSSISWTSSSTKASSTTTTEPAATTSSSVAATTSSSTVPEEETTTSTVAEPGGYIQLQCTATGVYVEAFVPEGRVANLAVKSIDADGNVLEKLWIDQWHLPVVTELHLEVAAGTLVRAEMGEWLDEDLNLESTPIATYHPATVVAGCATVQTSPPDTAPTSTTTPPATELPQTGVETIWALSAALALLAGGTWAARRAGSQ